MLVNPWNKNQDFASLTPETTVYTLRLHEEQFPAGLLCDLAWTEQAETKEFFWLKHPEIIGGIDENATVEPVTMPLAEYLRLHLAECSAMNPFYAVARIEFMDRWHKARATSTAIGGR